MSSETIVIDAREPFEYQQSHVEGALNIPPSDFMNGDFLKRLDNKAKGTPIIVYCLSGARSNSCIMFLKDAGFSDVTNGINQDHVRKMLSS